MPGKFYSNSNTFKMRELFTCEKYNTLLEIRTDRWHWKLCTALINFFHIVSAYIEFSMKYYVL